MPILNYTTKIDAMKTVGEIMAILSKAGATAILVEYSGSEPSSVSFQIRTSNGIISYMLPANSAGILSSLKKDRAPQKFQNQEQAVRVAWRITKDWILAQMAFIEAEQASIDQVFLPYAQDPETGKTVYDLVSTGKALARLTKT